MLVGGLIYIFLRENTHSLDNDWQLQIVPHPQEIQLKDGQQAFIVNSDTQIIICRESTAENEIEAEFLNEALAGFGVAPLSVHDMSDPCTSDNAIIFAEMNEGSKVLENFKFSTSLDLNEDYPGAEGYVIDVTPNRVWVLGADAAGTFYGVQSLMQMLSKSASGRINITPCTIIDYPDMPLRSAFYGFYLNALEDDSLLERAHHDFRKMARFKFNMIDLATHHYGHLEMDVPGHSNEKLWQRFAKLYAETRKFHLRPRVGGWAKWVNTKSLWGADLTTLEGIRTTQTLKMRATQLCTLRISTGQIAPNVIYDWQSGKTWEAEPVVVTNESGSVIYDEGRDYIINFGRLRSENYQKYFDTPQTNLEVLFSQVHAGEGEPAGYPLRWAATFNFPTTIQRKADGRIEDGQSVKVTFSYIGPDPWSLLKVRYCRSDRRLHTDGPDNYIWRWCTEPVRFLNADDFSLDVDETRVFAWDKRCLDSGKTRSRIWADDVFYYYKTIRAANPRARISMWSDMLDPTHNASVYGTQDVASILQDYGMTDVIMIPWKSSIARESIDFFSKHGFPIMPSCQELTEEGFSVAPEWAHYVREFYSQSHLPFGLMHCSWYYNLDSEQGWEQLATVADHAWSVAPYIIHKPVTTARVGENIKIVARAEGDKLVFDGKKVRPGPLPVESAYVWYRANSDSQFKRLTMSRESNEFTATIASNKIGSLEYYISMSDSFNSSYNPKLASKKPYKINIVKGK